MSSNIHLALHKGRTKSGIRRLQVPGENWSNESSIWLGIRAVPEHEGDPSSVILDSRPLAPYPELDRLFPVWPIPGTAMGSREE
jgi:hypothetical protein